MDHHPETRKGDKMITAKNNRKKDLLEEVALLEAKIITIKAEIRNYRNMRNQSNKDEVIEVICLLKDEIDCIDDKLRYKQFALGVLK